MNDLIVARVYAQALLDLIDDADQADGVAESLARFAAVLEAHGDLRLALFNPCYRAPRRLAILEPVLAKLGADDLARRFLCTLLVRRRLDALRTILRLFGELADHKFDRAHARVDVASPMTPVQEERLRRHLARLLDAKILLDVRRDPDLLAGFVVTARHRVFDASLRSQLDRIARAMAAPLPPGVAASPDGKPEAP